MNRSSSDEQAATGPILLSVCYGLHTSTILSNLARETGPFHFASKAKRGAENSSSRSCCSDQPAGNFTQSSLTSCSYATSQDGHTGRRNSMSETEGHSSQKPSAWGQKARESCRSLWRADLIPGQENTSPPAVPSDHLGFPASISARCGRCSVTPMPAGLESRTSLGLQSNHLGFES